MEVIAGGLASDPESVMENSHRASVKVHLEGVSKRYGLVQALHNVDLTVHTGEFLTLLGPSGSGKTTLLNMIAGMKAPSTGQVWIDGRDATALPPGKRDLGMVFQNYALMPHMTVFENIAFPLRVRKVSNVEVQRRVNDIIDLVKLTGFADRKPTELSGGQQQRVSVARCLVYNPALILMDEPLGALDKKLREEMQLELKRLHTALGVTALYVTHDQEEALTMSDRIVLMNKGGIEQIGTPDDLYFRPVSVFAAEFLGDSNILDGTLESAGRTAEVRLASGEKVVAKTASPFRAGEPVSALIRPENVVLTKDESTAPNIIWGEMVDTISFGGVIKSFVRMADGKTLVAQELNRQGRDSVRPGDRIGLSWTAQDVVLLPPRP